MNRHRQLREDDDEPVKRTFGGEWHRSKRKDKACEGTNGEEESFKGCLNEKHAQN